jgi:hypothetical protein
MENDIWPGLAGGVRANAVCGGRGDSPMDFQLYAYDYK